MSTSVLLHSDTEARRKTYRRRRPVPAGVLTDVARLLHMAVANRIGTRGTVRILDAGCGYGHFGLPVLQALVRRLQSEGREVTIVGIDKDGERLGEYREQARRLLPGVALELVHSLIEECDLDSAGTFDLVLAMWLFHRAHDLQSVVVRLAELCKPAGVIAFPVAVAGFREMLLEAPRERCTTSLFRQIHDLLAQRGESRRVESSACDPNPVLDALRAQWSGAKTVRWTLPEWSDEVSNAAALSAFRDGEFAAYEVVPKGTRSAIADAIEGEMAHQKGDPTGLLMQWELFLVGRAGGGFAVPSKGGDGKRRAMHDAFGGVWHVKEEHARLYRAMTIAFSQETSPADISTLPPSFLAGVEGRNALLARYLLYLALLRANVEGGEFRNTSLACCVVVDPSTRPEWIRLSTIASNERVVVVPATASPGVGYDVHVPEPDAEGEALLFDWLRRWGDRPPPRGLQAFRNPEDVVADEIVKRNLEDLVHRVRSHLVCWADDQELTLPLTPFSGSAWPLVKYLLLAWSLTHWRRSGSYRTEIVYRWRTRDGRPAASVGLGMFERSTPRELAREGIRFGMRYGDMLVYG